MISDILPDDVAVVVATAATSALPLTPGESKAIAAVSESRRLEFQAGRSAARLALAELGIHGHDLLPANDRRPEWPPGVVGAITHTRGFCAAAVARNESYLGIGIDAERLDRAIVGGVRDRICRPEELDLASAEPHAAHVIFSAKESYFKTYYPATLHWIGFHDARVTISAEERSFRIELIDPDAPRPVGLTDLTGRYAIVDGMVLSALAAEALPPTFV